MSLYKFTNLSSNRQETLKLLLLLVDICILKTVFFLRNTNNIGYITQI